MDSPNRPEMWISRISIRRKLVLMMMVVCTVTTILAALVFIVDEWLIVRDRMTSNLTAIAHVIGENCTGSLAFDDAEDAVEVLGSLMAISSIENAAVYKSDGSLFAVYHRDSDSNDVTRVDPGGTEGHSFDVDGITIRNTIVLEGTPIGIVVVRSDLSDLWAFIERGLAVIALFILLSFAIAFFVANRLQRMISTPISTLAETVKNVSESQDLSQRAQKHSDDEIGQLTDTFNNMLSEIERSDAALRESELRFRGLIDNAADAIFLFTTTGDVMVANQCACDSLGYTIQQLLRLNVRDFMKVESEIDGGFDEIWNPKLFHHAQTVNVLHQRSDGSTFPVEVRLGILQLDGNESVLALVRDMSDRQQLEAQLIEAQKLEAVGQLAGGIAHDFNNILQAIIGYSEIILNSTADKTVHELLDEVIGSANRATVLIRQLLAFSRKQMLELENIDLNDTVDDMAKMLRRVIGENIALTIKTYTDLPLVKADQGQMEQILMNLCVNARDAMPTGGTIDIKLNEIELDDQFCSEHAWARPGKYVQLSIRDTGTGMDASTLKHVFEPFFTTKRSDQGTGLGLATVYGIIRQHRGFVDVYSELGHGTVFRIYFPIVAGEKQMQVAQKVAAPQNGSETILLAEDDGTIRKLAKLILESAGYKIIAAEDGEIALDLFSQKKEEIHMLMLDIVMPNKGGIEVFKDIRDQGATLPVLFSSGYSFDNIDDDIFSNGEQSIIQKPYARAALLTKIREVLDSHADNA
jgi:PAS domain S-box-containing protein